MDDPRLDFISPDFDPHLALHNTLPLIVQHRQPGATLHGALDNLSKCRVLLPPDMPESLNVGSTGNVGTIPNQLQQSTEQAKSKAQSFKERALQQEEMVLQSCRYSMATVQSYVKPGPLRLLAGWLGQRVRVMTRHARGPRGLLHGTLIAYDKFMNLVLRDVEETYSVQIKVKQASGRVGMKLDKRHRSLPLVMMKGDSLAVVSLAPSEQP